MITRGYCDTALGQLHYRRSGGGGDPLLLLPHSGRSAQMFARLMSALSGSFDVIAVDLPGSGQSPPLAAGTSFEEIADAIAQMCGCLAVSRYHVYGIHTGNKIGAWLAHTGDAQSLVLAGQTHSLVADQEARNALIRTVASHALRADRDRTATLREWVEALRYVQNAGLDARALTDILESETYAPQRDEVVDHLLAWEARSDLYDANFRFDLGACLDALSVPTLVLEIATPAEDREIGRQSPLLLDRMQDARAVVLHEPDGIGFTMEHRADEIAGIVRDFVASLST